MSDPSLPRHIQMRRQYDGRRYMRHLSQSELNVRIRDIFLNMHLLMPDAKIGVLPIDDDSVVWIEKFTHALEEMQLRHGPYPAGFTRDIFHREPFPNFASELAAKAAKSLSAKGLKRREVFIKFGRRDHMEALVNSGGLRIQPASSFADKKHNPAIRDDELSLPFSLVLSRDEIVKVVANPQDVQPDAADQRIDIRLRSNSDYWLYCVTNSVQPRLFVDFNAEACVIIRDRAAFRERLRRAGATHFPHARLTEGNADYVDPLLPKSAKVFVPLAKHFGYTYQDEYRFCWVPSRPQTALTHLDINLGSLEDIADLIVL